MVVVETGEEGIPDFHRIYVETAKRAGFVHRAESAFRDVYRAFAARDAVRLLFARSPDGDAAATLMLLECGRRVIEPYGGMTEAGGESRANYLLKWEAIRTSRERGFAIYDLWGVAHSGIEQFKVGFGGREVRYVGAWELVVNPLVHGAAAVRAGCAWSWRVDPRVSAGPAGRRGRAVTRVVAAGSEPSPDWDALTVDPAGGHLLQGAAWAAHRRERVGARISCASTTTGRRCS